MSDKEYGFKLYPGDSLMLAARAFRATGLVGNEHPEMQQFAETLDIQGTPQWIELRYGYPKDPRRPASERDMELYTVEIIGIQLVAPIDTQGRMASRYFAFSIDNSPPLGILAWRIRVSYGDSPAFTEEAWKRGQGRTLAFHAEGDPERWGREAQRACRSTKLLLFWLTGKRRNPPGTGRPKGTGNLSNLSLEEVETAFAYLLAKHEYCGWPRPKLDELANYYQVDRTTFYRWRKDKGLVASAALEGLKSRAGERAKRLSAEEIKNTDLALNMLSHS